MRNSIGLVEGKTVKISDNTVEILQGRQGTGKTCRAVEYINQYYKKGGVLCIVERRNYSSELDELEKGKLAFETDSKKLTDEELSENLLSFLKNLSRTNLVIYIDTFIKHISIMSKVLEQTLTSENLILIDINSISKLPEISEDINTKICIIGYPHDNSIQSKISNREYIITTFNYLDNNYSGDISLRVPKTLHKELVDNAKIEGVSLNQYIMFILSKNI